MLIEPQIPAYLTDEESAGYKECLRHMGASGFPIFSVTAPVIKEVDAEVYQAMKNWPPFNSAHEAFAILNEEFDELKAHVWTNQTKRNLVEMRKEAIQVAAMAIRFAAEVCDEERGRK